MASIENIHEKTAAAFSVKLNYPVQSTSLSP